MNNFRTGNEHEKKNNWSDYKDRIRPYDF